MHSMIRPTLAVLVASLGAVTTWSASSPTTGPSTTPAPAAPAGFEDRFTETYHARVRELMELTGERERLVTAMAAVGTPLEKGYAEFYDDLVAGLTDDPAARRQFQARREERSKRFRERFVASLDEGFDRLAFESAVQVYRELYTPDDLVVLLEFLRTPAGRTFYGAHSQRMEDTVGYAQGQAIHLMRERLPAALDAERARIAAETADDPGDGAG